MISTCYGVHHVMRVDSLHPLNALGLVKQPSIFNRVMQGDKCFVHGSW